MKKQILSLAAATLLLAACSNENEVLQNNEFETPQTVAFHAGIGSSTRVNGVTWNKDDEVGISATGTDGVSYSNVKYVVAEDNTSATFNAAEGVDPIAYTNEGAMSFKAYYPYSADLDPEGKIEVNTSQEEVNADFLYAEKSSIAYSVNPTVNFEFRHVMSQLCLTVNTANGGTLSGKEVKIGGLKHEGTFDTTTGIAFAPAESAVIDWTIATLSSEEAFNKNLIIFPQDASAITISVGEQTATINLPMGTSGFQLGKKYTLTATVEKEAINAKVIIQGNTIVDWEDGSVAQKQKIAFISNADDAASCDAEAAAAYNWLATQSGKYEVTYLHQKDAADLTAYEMVWVHFDFENSDAAIHNSIKDYYAAGGDILASREAVKSLVAWGVVSTEDAANHCWDDLDETFDHALGITSVVSSHAIFNELSSNVLHPINIPNTDKKFRGWTFADDAAKNDWLTKNAATALGQDGSNANILSIVEFAQAGKGNLIAIGDPAFVWEGTNGEPLTDTPEVANLRQLASNAIDYLIGK